ncbi:alpha/beta hydrolase [Streptomyces sp. NBC_01462]|uniref:alpha/beta hydrolase n=1 Tax=Streptomyces sp. NBC_01462 TaxID=2903876 RepID=UPI002E35549C|nr:alpha/beta hydrolase [Streptomyces sp. NBC_01462]
MFAATDKDLTRNRTVELQNVSIPGPAGAPEIPLPVLSPVGRAAGAPVFYYMHGGGMIIGNSRAGVATVLDWAVDNGAVVVSVDYRLAPERPDHAPIEDCYTGLVWTHEHAAQIGGDQNRLVVTGTSAGGGLAAGVALLARDRGGPRLLGQVLMCPMLDDRFVSSSSRELDGEDIWDATSNMTGWHTFTSGGTPASRISARPGRAYSC